MEKLLWEQGKPAMRVSTANKPLLGTGQTSVAEGAGERGTLTKVTRSVRSRHAPSSSSSGCSSFQALYPGWKAWSWEIFHLLGQPVSAADQPAC